MDHLRKKWALKSLTIGPQFDKTDTVFWEEAFRGLPPLPDVDNVTVIHHYPTGVTTLPDFWKYFDRVLTRRDLFPALKEVHVKSDRRSRRLVRWLWNIRNAMPTIVGRGLGPCKLLAFG